MNIKRTSLFLMANLGAEASRIISAKERGDREGASMALLRAENILKEIKHLPDMQPRAQELESLARVLRGIAINHPDQHVSLAHLKSYFMPFALRFLATRG